MSILTFLAIWTCCVSCGLACAVLGPRILFKAGRKWAIVLYDIDIQVRKRYWSLEEAAAEADKRNRLRVSSGIGPDWSVRPVLTYREYRNGSGEGLLDGHGGGPRETPPGAEAGDGSGSQPDGEIAFGVHERRPHLVHGTIRIRVK